MVSTIGKKMKIISIATDFSEVPLGRYYSDGENSGQRFREEFLLPALKDNEFVTVKIDGVEGYGSSFLDEAFGGLVRKNHFTKGELHKRLKIENSDQDFALYKDLIERYIEAAVAEE